MRECELHGARGGVGGERTCREKARLCTGVSVRRSVCCARSLGISCAWTASRGVTEGTTANLNGRADGEVNWVGSSCASSIRRRARAKRRDPRSIIVFVRRCSRGGRCVRLDAGRRQRHPFYRGVSTHDGTSDVSIVRCRELQSASTIRRTL